MSTIDVAAARGELPRLLDAVEQGEEVTLTRHGKPVAVIVRPKRLWGPERLVSYAGADEIEERLRAAAARSLPPTGSPSIEQAEALVADVRAQRDDR
ncbi:MAG: type II toxin-antitoxin system prevent-host-death family antitoxin [Actinobacteria bacterium]|nr:type II toxin-antitoxin system prevent-host-death family antitoxin [Actinomycetota bacterium]